jgi:hypothetical protein
MYVVRSSYQKPHKLELTLKVLFVSIRRRKASSASRSNISFNTATLQNPLTFASSQTSLQPQMPTYKPRTAWVTDHFPITGWYYREQIECTPFNLRS